MLERIADGKDPQAAIAAMRERSRYSSTYVQVFTFCGGLWYVNAREVAACWNLYKDAAWTYFIIPFQTPDFGTQLHEISHIFLQNLHPDAESFPRLKEGSGMYFESGSFDALGNFIATSSSVRDASLAELARTLRDVEAWNHIASSDALSPVGLVTGFAWLYPCSRSPRSG
jgi:hypothetical protein